MKAGILVADILAAVAAAVEHKVFAMRLRLSLVLAFASSVCFMLSAAEVELIFTHDIHSHLDSFRVMEEDGVVSVRGGVSRIKSVADGIRSENPDALMIDAGDFSMGSLYQTVYSDCACELRMLSEIGTEFTTFGNHEFDYGDAALAEMVRTARASGAAFPQILSCNCDFSGSAFPAEFSKRYAVVEKGGVKIALFGVMGPDSIVYTGASDVRFSDYVTAAKEVVDEIESIESPDFIIALSHSGTNPDRSRSEDEILASEVDGIDFILSGHTHDTLDSPLVVNGTVIGCCGEYGENVGRVRFAGTREDGWRLEEYEIIPVDGSVRQDAGTEAYLAEFRKFVDSERLGRLGMSFDGVIARNEADFPHFGSIYEGIGENVIGNFLADSIAYSYGRHFGGEKVVSIVPAGLIRDTLRKGDLTVADCFACHGLGCGTDGSAGYSLCKFYLTGKELKRMAEVTAHFTAMMPSANLYFSGLDFEVNLRRLPFNKVSSCSIRFPGDVRKKIDDGALYPVVTDSYTLGMVGVIGKLSKGLYGFVAKDRDGNPGKAEDFVLRDEGGNEMKAWVAVAEYASSFERDAGGVSVIPASAALPTGRRVIRSSFAHGFFGNPNRFAFIEIAAATVVLAVLSFIGVFVLRLVRRRRKG